MFSNGRILIFFGCIYILLGMFTGTTVSTPFGEVHNIGLMEKKQNHFLLGGLLLIAGLILKTRSQNKSDNDEANTPKDESLTEAFSESYGEIKNEVKKSWPKYTHWDLRIAASGFFGFFVSMAIAIFTFHLQIENMFGKSIVLLTLAAFIFSMDKGDGKKIGIAIISITKKIAYLFMGLCIFWIASIWLSFFSLLNINDNSFFDFYIASAGNSETDLIQTAAVSIAILFMIGLAFIPVKFANVLKESWTSSSNNQQTVEPSDSSKWGD